MKIKNGPYAEWVLCGTYLQNTSHLSSCYLETKHIDSKVKQVFYRTKCEILKRQIRNNFFSNFGSVTHRYNLMCISTFSCFSKNKITKPKKTKKIESFVDKSCIFLLGCVTYKSPTVDDFFKWVLFVKVQLAWSAKFGRIISY